MTEDILDRTHALGLRALFYTNQLAEPESVGGRRCWIPSDCVGNDGKAGIIWRPASGGRRDLPGAAYDFDGWEPWADSPAGCGTMNGGRYRTFATALAWMEHYAPHRLTVGELA